MHLSASKQSEGNHFIVKYAYWKAVNPNLDVWEATQSFLDKKALGEKRNIPQTNIEELNCTNSCKYKSIGQIFFKCKHLRIILKQKDSGFGSSKCVYSHQKEQTWQAAFFQLLPNACSRSTLLLFSSYCCLVIRNLPLMKLVENASFFFFFLEVSFFCFSSCWRISVRGDFWRGFFCLLFCLFVCLMFGSLLGFLSRRHPSFLGSIQC